MFKKILIFLGVILVIIIAFLGYSGFLSKVTIVEKEVGPYIFVGKEYIGDYKMSGIHQDSIYKDLISKNIEVTKGFGIYRDDPEVVQPDKCRFMVGCVLPEKDTIRKVELEREAYIIQNMHATKSMFVEFPFRSSLSIMAAVLKVYPALKKYSEEHNYQPVESLEIYTEDKILISMEMKK